MKKSILATAIVSSILSVSAAHAAPSFDGNFELNTDAISKAEGDSTYKQDGRLELNVTGRHTMGDNFFAGRGSLLIKTTGDAVVDDAYIQFGNSTWDLQAGRFEAVNLFPKGKDTLIEHVGAVDVYEANLVRGREGDEAGQFALHFNANDSVKFELATIYGDPNIDDDTSTVDNTTAISGVRPSVTFAAGDATITAGYESLKYDLTAGGEVKQSGYAVAANFDVAAANVNLAATFGKDHETDEKVTSIMANMTYGNFGLGVISSSVDDGANDPSLLTTYVAYTMPVLDIENATVTLAGSYSSAKDVGTANDKVTAARVRFNYGF
ncbi:carbohydrate porin [Marinomonas rhizomae]|uniref:carbohydrate porin n=1 Tax=Marinomonas rhizomae TaxID=491948 RepID=UPI00210398B9|nr:carbohydrate porin [Marinomonas rhizomae]UTV99745.1 carbohydrate porin [Marinomonas rhizomae]